MQSDEFFEDLELDINRICPSWLKVLRHFFSRNLFLYKFGLNKAFRVSNLPMQAHPGLWIYDILFTIDIEVIFSVLLTCEANLHLSLGIQTILKEIGKSNIANIMNFQMNLNRMDKWFDEMQYLTLIVGPFNIENLNCKRQVWHSYSGLVHFSHNIDFEELLCTIFNQCWCKNTFALKKCSIYAYFQSFCQERVWDDALRMCELACLSFCLILQKTAATLKLLSINNYVLSSNVCGTDRLLLIVSFRLFQEKFRSIIHY